MIESPLLDDMKVLFRQMGLQEGILIVLKQRFGSVPDEIATAVNAIRDTKRLHVLTELAPMCSNLEGFSHQITVLSTENNVPDDIVSAVRAIHNTKQLFDLIRPLCRASNLEEFRAHLTSIASRNDPIELPLLFGPALSDPYSIVYGTN